ncbi:hypothetical protein FRACYDRAFT_197900, partial [Fragilariopsis cylindrus CCMP1102]
LGRWVNRQRINFKNNELSKERINHLESIGFVWDSHDAKWMEMYKLLVAYKKRHTSTNVPSKYKKVPKLGSWVLAQRQLYRNNELSEEQINHLESIGFIWNVFDAKWTATYHILVEYKKQHKGSTTVPTRYTKDPSLGKWVYKQRCDYNKGNLSEKRLKLLNAINFVWSA